MSGEENTIKKELQDFEEYEELVALCKSLNVSPKGLMNELKQSVNQHVSLQMLLQDEKLINLSKMEILGQLTAMLVHELKQPLNTLSIGVDTLALLLKQEPYNKESIDRVLHSMKNQVLHTSNLVHTINDFNRNSPIGQKEMGVTAFMESIVLMIEKEMIKEGVFLDVTYPQKDFKIIGDKVKLQQLFLNLLMNARDAIIDKKRKVHENIAGEVKMSIQRVGSTWVTEIRDNGIGVLQKDMEKIFELFYTTKPQGEGTGIGLVIVRQIIEQHGGEILWDSDYLEGTVFKIILPLVQAQKS